MATHGSIPRTLRSRIRVVSVATAVVAMSAAFLMGAPAAHASVIDVTTTIDGGAGSLRAAISQANGAPGPDIINLPAGTYTLTIGGANEDLNATGDLDSTGDLVIAGAGAATTIIDAAGIDRVLHVVSGTTTVQNLTVTGGNSGLGTTAGGGILQTGGNLNVLDAVIRDNKSWSGAGIVSSVGTVDIRRSEILNNIATSEPGNGSVGGGIDKANFTGALNISDSLLAGNQSVLGNAGSIYSTADTTIVNSTITGSAQYTNSILFEKFAAQVGTVTLRYVTIAGNTSVGLSAGIMVNVIAGSSLAVTLEGVLLKNNTGSSGAHNCAVQNVGTITSVGSNLSDDATCTGFAQPTDLNSNGATVLGALGDNGGPTRTMALTAGSSAIDAAVCNPLVTTDQRLAARPVINCDIGAYEADAVAPPTTTPTTAVETTTTTAAPVTTTTADPTTTTADPTTTTTDPALPDQTTTTIDPALDAAAVATSTTLATPPATIYTYRTSVRSTTLPVTGPSDVLRFGLLALGLIAAGVALMLGARRSSSRRLTNYFDDQRSSS